MYLWNAIQHYNLCFATKFVNVSMTFTLDVSVLQWKTLRNKDISSCISCVYCVFLKRNVISFLGRYTILMATLLRNESSCFQQQVELVDTFKIT